MAMGKRTLDVEVLAGDHMGLARQGLSDEPDRLGRQVGKVGERLVLDLAALAIGVTQQMGLVDLVLVLTTCRRHMHRTAALVTSSLSHITVVMSSILVSTLWTRK